MLRRHAMLAAAGAAVPLALAARAGSAQAASSPYKYPTFQVLQLGTVAKQTSQLILTRSKNALTRAFAQLEIIEQTAAAQALTANYNPPPPALTPAQQAIVAKVRDANADALDYVYVGVQIDGHQQLLAIQQQLLAAGLPVNYDIVHEALLLRSNIQQHLLILNGIVPYVRA